MQFYTIARQTAHHLGTTSVILPMKYRYRLSKAMEQVLTSVLITQRGPGTPSSSARMGIMHSGASTIVALTIVSLVNYAAVLALSSTLVWVSPTCWQL